MAAIIALIAVAVSGTAAIPVAIFVLIALCGLCSFPCRARARARGDAARLQLGASFLATLPDSARDILECVDEPLLVLDQSGRVIFANKASQALVGADAEKKRISAVLRTPEVLEAVERVLAGGMPEIIAFSVLVPVQHHYEAHVARTGPAPDSGAGSRLSRISSARGKELLRADFGRQCQPHELRTPLAAVSGFIGHAARSCPQRTIPMRARQFLDIMSVSKRAACRRLIGDLLSLTQHLNSMSAIPRRARPISWR